MPDKNTPLIIDFGSYETRIGYADEAEPRIICQPCLQRIKHSNDWSIGKEISSSERLRPRAVRLLFSADLLQNFVMVEAFFDRIFSDLGYDDFITHPIIVSEPPCAALLNRFLLQDLLYRVYKVSKLSFVCSPFASIYSIKNKLPENALIINAGHSVTHVLFIRDGQIIPNISQRIPLGGNHVFQTFLTLLKDRAPFLDFLLSEDDIYDLMFKSLIVPSSYENWANEVETMTITTRDPKIKIKTQEDIDAEKSHREAVRNRLISWRAKKQAESEKEEETTNTTDEEEEESEEEEEEIEEQPEIIESEEKPEEKVKIQSYALQKAHEARKAKFIEEKAKKIRQQEWRQSHPTEYAEELRSQARVYIDKYNEIKFRLRESREKMQVFCLELGLHPDEDPFEYLLDKLHEINYEMESYGAEPVEIPSAINGFVNSEFCYALRYMLHIDPEHDETGRYTYPLLWERVAPIELILAPSKLFGGLQFEEMSSLAARATQCSDSTRKDFHPSGIIEVLENGLRNSSIEYRRSVASNIHLCGGLFKIPGLKERISKYVTSWMPSNEEVEISIAEQPELSTYHGMRKFALDNDDIYMTFEEFEKAPQGHHKIHNLANLTPFNDPKVYETAINDPVIVRGKQFSLTGRRTKNLGKKI